MSLFTQKTKFFFRIFLVRQIVDNCGMNAAIQMSYRLNAGIFNHVNISLIKYSLLISQCIKKRSIMLCHSFIPSLLSSGIENLVMSFAQS